MIKVLVVAEDSISRAGMTYLLDGQEDLSIIGHLACVDLDGELIRRLGPDVVLVELEHPPLQGLAGLIADLSAEWPVLLVGSELPVSLRSLSSGVSMISRKSGAARLAAALRAVHEGLLVIDTDYALDAIQSGDQDGVLEFEALTERELEVLHLMAGGLTNRAIAQELGITENTVKYHVNAILGKTGAQSRTDAVVRAVRAGVIPV
jgi:two-component system nitrate/nitrite response regulator NarL